MALSPNCDTYNLSYISTHNIPEKLYTDFSPGLLGSYKKGLKCFKWLSTFLFTHLCFKCMFPLPLGGNLRMLFMKVLFCLFVFSF